MFMYNQERDDKFKEQAADFISYINDDDEDDEDEDEKWDESQWSISVYVIPWVCILQILPKFRKISLIASFCYIY